MSVAEDAAQIADRAHPGRAGRSTRTPEIGLDLPRDEARVLAALDGLPLEITLGPGAQLGHRGAARRAARPGRAAPRRHGTRCR